MFPEQLKRILNLIKKTGDKVVFFDAGAPNDSYVLMNFDSYEGMLEEEDKGYPQAENMPEKLEKKEEYKPNYEEQLDNSRNLTEEDLTDKINREISVWKNNQNAESLAADDRPKKAWSIPPQVKNKAQEVE
jgi:hypothetical protein